MVKLKLLANFSLLLILLSHLIPPQNAYATIATDLWIHLGTDPVGDAYLAEVADSEQSGGAGEVWLRDYTFTHASDSKREYLRETRKGCGYQITWIYSFNSLPPRSDTKFYIEGRTTVDDISEKMMVQWSTSLSGPWLFLGNVTCAPERLYGPWDISNDMASTIYIKIEDSIKTKDRRSGILIDHMYIACVTDGADKTGLYFYNDGTYAYFNETLAGKPDISSFTYIVYLDKPVCGEHPADFRLVYSSGIAKIQKWDNNNQWVNITDITVTESSSPYSLCFIVSLANIANPEIQQDTRIWFEEHLGPNHYSTLLDRAPDKGGYILCAEVIPELPGLTPLVFIPAVTATICILYAKRFKRVQ